MRFLKISSLMFLVIAILWTPSPSSATPKGEKFGLSIEERARLHRARRPSGSSPRHVRPSARSNGNGQAGAKEVQREFAAKQRAYKKAVASYNFCSDIVGSTACGAPPDQPLLETLNGLTLAQVKVAALPPREIAYLAFARLKLSPPKPVIGPSPTLNPWKMAAVGYPLWLSVSGNTHPAAVVDTVGPLRVSLDAHVSRVVFDMGDGHQVTCRAVTNAWNPSVKPGQKSPDCGYVYQKPSLPSGPYTVTATTYWSVAWTVTRDRGVIDYAQTAATTVPVGELQVLVR